MSARVHRLELRKKNKPAQPGAPPGSQPNRVKSKVKLPKQPPPASQPNKIRQHYTRVQRG
jgi:hypothetical protein